MSIKRRCGSARRRRNHSRLPRRAWHASSSMQSVLLVKERQASLPQVGQHQESGRQPGSSEQAAAVRGTTPRIARRVERKELAGSGRQQALTAGSQLCRHCRAMRRESRKLPPRSLDALKHRSAAPCALAGTAPAAASSCRRGAGGAGQSSDGRVGQRHCRPNPPSSHIKPGVFSPPCMQRRSRCSRSSRGSSRQSSGRPAGEMQPRGRQARRDCPAKHDHSGCPPAAQPAAPSSRLCLKPTLHSTAALAAQAAAALSASSAWPATAATAAQRVRASISWDRVERQVDSSASPKWVDPAGEAGGHAGLFKFARPWPQARSPTKTLAEQTAQAAAAIAGPTGAAHHSFGSQRRSAGGSAQSGTGAGPAASCRPGTPH